LLLLRGCECLLLMNTLWLLRVDEPSNRSFNMAVKPLQRVVCLVED